MPKKSSQQGFALILVLIFLEIFSLLSITALQSNILAARMTHNQWHKNTLIYAANQQLTSLASQSSFSCLMQPIPTQKLIQRPLSVWQQSSCTGNLSAFTYYYVVETLGNDSCAHIINTAINTTVNYYRITLLLIDSLHPAIKTLLQATTVTPGTGGNVCHAVMREIMNGQQTLHKLI